MARFARLGRLGSTPMLTRLSHWFSLCLTYLSKSGQSESGLAHVIRLIFKELIMHILFLVVYVLSSQSCFISPCAPVHICRSLVICQMSLKKGQCNFIIWLVLHFVCFMTKEWRLPGHGEGFLRLQTNPQRIKRNHAHFVLVNILKCNNKKMETRNKIITSQKVGYKTVSVH